MSFRQHYKNNQLETLSSKPIKNNYTAKVSVIVLVYNVEAYIERCARSLFEQTLDLIEYIFINDCSPDHSMEILRNVICEYPNRQSQIHIINHIENMGAAYSREEGIKFANGEYIIHCDSDDWTDIDMYRKMYTMAKEKNNDIVICDWYETDGVNHEIVYQNLNEKQDLIQGVIKRSISGSLWNKLISQSLYKKVSEFPRAHMMEDVCYSVQILVENKRSIGHISQPLYYYYNNKSSICHHPSDASCLERCKQSCVNIDTIIHFLRSRNLEDKYKNEIVILKNSARVFIWGLYMRDPRKYRSIWRSVYPEINKTYPFTKGIRRTLSIIFFLANLGLYPYMLKIFNIFKGFRKV